MGKNSGKDVYESYKSLDWGGHLALLIVNFLGVVGTYYLWTRRKHMAISTRRPKLILLNVVVNLFFDLTWSLDELFILKSGGLPCAYREIKDSIYYLLVNEVLLLRSIVLYMTFNKTLHAQRALATRKNHAISNAIPAVNPAFRDGQGSAPGIVFRMSQSFFNMSVAENESLETKQELHSLRQSSGTGSVHPRGASGSVLELPGGVEISSQKSQVLSHTSEESVGSPASQRALVSSPHMSKRGNSVFEHSVAGTQLVEAMHNEFSDEQIQNLRKLQYLGSTRFLILLVLVTVGLYVAPYVFHWIANPTLFDVSFIDSQTCFDSNVYRSLFVLQFVYAFGSLVILVFVRMKEDIFGAKSELILLAIYWIYFTVSQNAVYVALYYNPIIAIWQWTGNRLIFYLLFSYRPLFFLKADNPLRFNRWKRVSGSALQDANGVQNNEFEASTAALREILEDSKGFELFKEYLASEFCSEALLFWREVQDYRKLCAQALAAEQTHHISNQAKFISKSKALAKKIFELYLTKDSAFQVNLSSQQLAQYSIQNWNSSGNDLNADLFTDAEEEVLLVMTYGPFPRFVKTKAFLDYKLSSSSSKKSELAVISLVPMSELVPQQD
eukprot:TRINITY_DN26803_c0_g1_i1.p1 TRINITY_DN26803_c0_g1~~TRINITY_DN26803_c0_g1_i1.p1  ORF type:complete len:612 (-),score=133.16 TRINITY_DN26803_c0_g1_i1:60-1895(-)